MAKFKGKYRIGSTRMPNWNYAGNGRYYLTIVAQNRECNLGEIKLIDEQPTMVLSDFGQIVENEFLKSFEIRNELFLDEYVIMPNHLHMIVILKKNDVETFGQTFQPPQNGQTFQPPQNEKYPYLIRKPKSISSFVAGFKSAVNSKIDDYIDEHELDIPKYNKNNHFFQPNYHDRVIRNETEYHRIKKYIKKEH